MDRSEHLLQFLRETGIPYTVHEHEPKLTIEACQTIEGIDWQQAAMCKNVFLCNRQETAYYLVLLRHDRPFRTSVVSKLLGVSRLSFAKPEKLLDMLQLDPGAVNPLSLVFDTDKRVTLGIDDALLGFQRLLFHPGVNWLTVELETADFLHRFLPTIKHPPVVLSIPETQGAV